MQLKRDTDFALRILFCLKQAGTGATKDGPGGCSLTELAVRTGLSKTVAGRICDTLAANGILLPHYESETGEESCYSIREPGDCSLLDVVVAAEGTGRIFAVFDRRSDMYHHCEQKIQTIQDRTESLLREIKITQFLDCSGNGERYRSLGEGNHG